MAAVTINQALQLNLEAGIDPLMILRGMLSSDHGKSGANTAGSGISLAGSATIDCATELGFYPRQVYIETAGNFSFKTLDDNTHVLPVADKTWITGIFIKEIYEVSHATLATTATGVHCF